jgi:hypothetical protein
MCPHICTVISHVDWCVADNLDAAPPTLGVKRIPLTEEKKLAETVILYVLSEFFSRFCDS